MATFPRKTPLIDSEGLFVLRAPFFDLMKLNAIYMVKAIRSFQELSILNIEPYSTYYAPLNISQADFKDDAAAGAHIITLVSKIPFSNTGDNKESVIYVPDTYILEYPSSDNVNYFNFVIAMEMGPLPEWFNEQQIMDDISDIVLAKTGLFGGNPVQPDPILNINVYKNSHPVLVSSIDSATIEQARIAAIEQYDPTVTQLKALQEQYDVLLQKYNTLSQYLIDNPP